MRQQKITEKQKIKIGSVFGLLFTQFVWLLTYKFEYLFIKYIYI